MTKPSQHQNEYCSSGSSPTPASKPRERDRIALAAAKIFLSAHNAVESLKVRP